MNAENVGQRIDLITSELQGTIMLTRMQPIGNVFGKFPRVVRDLSSKLNKEIDLTIVGKDVELDKTIIESINALLTHLVRNSVDHGIELPEDRKRLGKPSRGIVTLKAYHAAGQVVIETIDDGKGLDGEVLAEAAINKGLITPEQAQLMSEKEKVKRSDIEELGGKRVVQYRGGSLSLIAVDDVAMVQPIADNDDLLVIVFNIASQIIGLLAIGPIDAMEISVSVDESTLKQHGIMGSTIIDGETTMPVDIYEVVGTLFPEWFEDQEIYEVEEEGGSTPTILIAEDSNFFRTQVKNYMKESGYDVLAGEDGALTWELLQEHADEVTMVVTDIEVPNMNGLELTETIRRDPRFKDLPIIALTTLAGDEDVAKGKAVGIDEYHIKLDKEKLMASVHHYAKQVH